MKQIEIVPCGCAADQPALSSPAAPALPGARVPGRPTETLAESALDAGRDPRPDRRQRADGWTPERIRIFLHALADGGIVIDAAKAAGMTKQSAYALRNRSAGRPFLLAWRAALVLARRRLVDEVVARAIDGCVETIYRDGRVWGEHHRYDNRLTMAVLARLDAQAETPDGENGLARLVAEEFDQFVDILCSDGDGAAAAASDFIVKRCALGHKKFDEGEIYARAAHYARHGVGLAAEIDKAGTTG